MGHARPPHAEQCEHPHPKDGPPVLPASGVHFNEARGFNEPLQRLRRFCEDNGLACKYTSGYASVEVELLHDGRRAGKHWRLKFDRQKAGGRREEMSGGHGGEGEGAIGALEGIRIAEVR